jgi:hypothetical protein
MNGMWKIMPDTGQPKPERRTSVCKGAQTEPIGANQALFPL